MPLSLAQKVQAVFTAISKSEDEHPTSLIVLKQLIGYMYDKVDALFTNYSQKVTPIGTDQIMINDSADDGALKWIEISSLPSGGGGEANTASNVGTAGVGVYKAKVGVDLRFKKINAGSSKVSITDDTGNDEIDIDVVEANFTHTHDTRYYTETEVDTFLSGKANTSHTHAQSDVTNLTSDLATKMTHAQVLARGLGC